MVIKLEWPKLIFMKVIVSIIFISCCMYNLEIFYFFIFVYKLQRKSACQKKRNHYNKGDDVDKKP